MRTAPASSGGQHRSIHFVHYIIGILPQIFFHRPKESQHCSVHFVHYIKGSQHRFVHFYTISCIVWRQQRFVHYVSYKVQYQVATTLLTLCFTIVCIVQCGGRMLCALGFTLLCIVWELLFFSMGQQRSGRGFNLGNPLSDQSLMPRPPNAPLSDQIVLGC